MEVAHLTGVYRYAIGYAQMVTGVMEVTGYVMLCSPANLSPAAVPNRPRTLLIPGLMMGTASQ